jgi:hypothetical protein
VIIRKLTMDQHGTGNTTSMEVHGRLKEINGGIKLAQQQQHGTKGVTIIKIDVARP